jgi:Spy/CpxP family protein refolding chaperone
MTTPVLPRWWAFAIVGLIVANLISLVVFFTMQAKKPPHPPEPFSRGITHLMQVMNFDSAQQQQIISLRNEHEKNMQPLLEKKRTLKEALFSLAQLEKVSDAALEQTTRSVADNEQALDKLTFSFIRKVRGVANPQQLVRFDSLLQRMVGATISGMPPHSNQPPESALPQKYPTGDPPPMPLEHNKHIPPPPGPPPSNGPSPSGHHPPGPPPPGHHPPGPPPHHPGKQLAGDTIR